MTALNTRTSAEKLTGAMPSGGVPRSPASAAQVLVALSHDGKLIAALRAVAAAQHPVMSVGSEVDLAAALMTHSSGVALLDAAAVATPIAQLAARLRNQFPDLVLVVAGGLDDQGALAQLIADGSVHRFLHKPVSEQRVRLFVGAAWRRHEEVLSGARAAAATSAPQAKAGAGKRWLLAIVAVAAVVAPLAWRAFQEPPAPGAPLATHGTPAAVAGDAALEDLLARADRALDAGALVAPAGENAAQLYREALQHNARDPRAANGLEEVINKLVTAGDAELRAGHLDAAQVLCDAARAVNPEHPRTAFLAAQISAQRERVVLRQAQRAAAAGDLGRALAVLDNAARGAQPSSLATEKRAQIARAQVDARVTQFLQRGRDALEHGQLIEPTEQNARFYIESALALAPEDATVQRARQDLLARLLAEGGQALAAGNPDTTDYWAAAAGDAGADQAQVASLRENARHLRSAATAQAPARAAVADSSAVAALDAQLAAAPAGAAAAVAQPAAFVNASTLTQTRYVAPRYPPGAQLSRVGGWVDVQFTVTAEGSVADVSIVGAQPVGVFERSALDAVRRWRYRPVTQDGHALAERSRVRVLFEAPR
ncbi:MAG TPA: TonB family protein [Steroidobacteraceae bacterium]|nr:TonB family protein [Steroidobacteraceae bacterium]